MVKSLVSQEDFLESVRNGGIQNPRLVIPCKFANGYFFKGTFGNRNVYATIDEKTKERIKQIWDAQKLNNPEEF